VQGKGRRKIGAGHGQHREGYGAAGDGEHRGDAGDDEQQAQSLRVGDEVEEFIGAVGRQVGHGQRRASERER
jgi:hypothetical protein